MPDITEILFYAECKLVVNFINNQFAYEIGKYLRTKYFEDKLKLVKESLDVVLLSDIFNLISARPSFRRKDWPGPNG